MRLEAVDHPILYRASEGEIFFQPGTPTEVHPKRGEKILQKCQGKVRVFQPDWHAAWNDVARMTHGIPDTDSRFHPVQQLIDGCDDAYLANDWKQFQESFERLKAVIQ